MRVSVIGGSRIDDETYEVAREVGRLLGERGHTVVCGGLGGTMEAVCRGAREATASEGASSAERSSAGHSSGRSPREDGDEGTASREHGAETVGLLPGEHRAAANEWVTTPIATGMGNARNVMVPLNGDAVIAVDGAAGTLSELGHALDFHRPIAGLDTHSIELEGFEAVETPAEAVEYVESAVEE